MAEKADKTVVRNAAYKCGGLNKRERHNERKNIDYMNDDIIPERAAYNVHFKRCSESSDDEISGYEKAFDKMLADGVISTHGLPKNPNIIDEMVFDVNTSYFDRHGEGNPDGGYEYAKSFFEEAYKLAVKLIGGEQYVLSAVMHADERNSDISEKLGRDVYHYHLHVVYIPVVRKELRFSKDNKDPELRGKLKEVITQVSHSKKWPRTKKVDENGEPVKTKNGKAVLVNSYSLLQDHFFEHMREAGYDDIERGERGSTAEHLSVMEFKNKKEKEKAVALTTEIEAKQGVSAALDEENERKKKRLDGLDKKTAIAKKEVADFADIDRMGEKHTMFGDVAISPDDWKKVSGLAKEGIKSRTTITDMKGKNSTLSRKVGELEKRLEGYESNSITENIKYHQAMRRAPRRLSETVADIMRQPPEKQGQEMSKERTKSVGIEL